ncbi:MAG: hypothetical protein LBU73_09505 [Helicobacteraceae bacterium]|jgi:hypothetical protein|nr:hypothetical protein [Helicobacteraceae bacterium]
MRIRNKVIAGLIAAALALPMWANHAIKIDPDQWHLIGITGYYQVAGSSTGGETLRPEFGANHVVIDVADPNYNISWDANTTDCDHNGMVDNGVGSVAANSHFEGDVLGGAGNGVQWSNNPTVAGNDQLGFPYHSIVGIRVMNNGAGSGALKAAVNFLRPAQLSNGSCGKNYGDAMITMYIASPYSAMGDPDVMLVFAGNMIGKQFRIAFKSAVGDKWNFKGGDKVYVGNFGYNYTFDKPMKIGEGLTEIVEQTTAGTANNGSSYRSLANTIDMNMTALQEDGFGELNTSNFYALDIPFTAYQYRADSGNWAIADIRGLTRGSNQKGTQRIDVLKEKASKGSSNSVHNKVKGDFDAWTKGYGYWVRLWDDDNVSTEYNRSGFPAGDPRSDTGASQPVILASDDIRNAGDYSGILSPGWNLLAFPDETLRYTASGFVTTNASAITMIVGPFGEINVTGATSITGISGCVKFNADVFNENNRTSQTNKLEVSCFSDGTHLIYISHKPFKIILDDPGNVGDIYSLAGYNYKTEDLLSLDIYNAAATGLRTRLGEYAILVEPNQQYLDAVNAMGGLPHIGALPTAGALGIGLPSWYTIDPGVINVDPATTYADVLTNTGVNSFIGYIRQASVPIPSYADDRYASAYEIDSNSTGVGYSTTTPSQSMFLLAANVRFYIRDNVAVRVFDSRDPGIDRNATPELVFDYGGGSYSSNPIDINATASIPNLIGALPCVGVTAATEGIIAQTHTATGGAVEAMCYGGNGTNDSNKSIAFFSTQYINFDVKEVAPSNQLLVDRYLKSNEENETVYGMFKRVVQPSQLSGSFFVNATDDGGFNMGGLSNLTYTSVWAEDFPERNAINYLAGNGFKTEMILTGVTASVDTSISPNQPAGTISWKALDLTRDPKAWFDVANNFEIFYTEKERGYWVYLGDRNSYQNQVTVSDVAVNASSIVTKHFNNKTRSGDEINVFNWFDGYVTAKVGGLVRTDGYTSGESYTVNGYLAGSERIPMSTTGAVSSAAVDFTAYLNDFEVSSLRPIGYLDFNVTASDGLGGSATGGTLINYAKPATPTLSFNGNTLIVNSTPSAEQVVIYQGDVTDEDTGAAQRVYNGAMTANGSATQGSVDLSTIEVNYPDPWPLDSDMHIIPAFDGPDYQNIGIPVVVELRVIAATQPYNANEINSMSVFSNMRAANYIPAYTDTFHVTANGEVNVTKHTAAFGNAENGYDPSRGDDVAFRGANGKNLTLVYQPINPNQALAANQPRHVNVNMGGSVAQIQYLTEYAGQIFYVYDNATGSWFYGVFPGDDLDLYTTGAVSGQLGMDATPPTTNSQTWGQSGFDLKLSQITGVSQKL